MENWRTLIRINKIHEAYIIQSQLELEGFEVRILDELTTQVAPHLTVAQGGARIQVHATEWENAAYFLSSLGYTIEQGSHTPKWFDRLDSFTASIPLLKKLKTEARIFTLIALIFAAVIIPVAIAQIPSNKDRLVSGTWCVSEVKHNNTLVEPLEEAIYISFNNCPGSIDFSANGSVFLPPYGDYSISGSWQLSKSHLIIEVGDVPAFRQEGRKNYFLDAFKYEFSNEKLHLKSGHTEITLVKFHF